MRLLMFTRPLLLLLGSAISAASAQQLSIARIDAMPDKPSPYFMRDWRHVALGYDSLVYDLNRSGQFLPLIFWNNSPVNYPSRPSFGLHTVVGPTAPGNSEAINVLPSIVGATLAGVDKSNQGGNNWVLMSQEFFNIKSQEYVYLNQPAARSGDDWWYDTMPNVFFYQIYWLYPGMGDSEQQFVTVADRWLEAVRKMGGSVTPWSVPNMDHRGWELLTMTPNDEPHNYHEPEAAGALAWLFYSAWKETGELKYRSAAELSMEFLDSYPTNPSYELQLAYGAYTAARMNAELSTTFDIPRIVSWCFDVGPIRSWGTVIGRWGGYDCSGLVGEVNGSNDYAFAMNTFEQVGALVPLVRYDDRFAHAIGKWVVNAANAARLFYPNSLPGLNQDSEDWSLLHDPNGYIGHEALRQRQVGGITSPYATGDAISGGWGHTNLTLYGSSHVGILGGIIDTTNIEGILQLDLLKTDYFRDSAFASYLYFNPDSSFHPVSIGVGQGQHDLYDAVANSFLKRNVSGQVAFDIPGNEAVLLVVVPSGGAVTYQGSRMLVNGVVVDYRSGNSPANSPPRIRGFGAQPDPVYPGHTARLYSTAVDPDGDSLGYVWSSTAGGITGTGREATWTAPSTTGMYRVQSIVHDGQGGSDSAAVNIAVVDSTGLPPTIVRIFAQPGKIDLNETSALTCSARDLSGYPLTYSWTARQGDLTGLDSSATWTAPGTAGNYFVLCTVFDGRGGQATDSVQLEVRDFRVVQTGELVAFFPFNGNANDESGFEHHGTVNGASLVPDRLGSEGKAYSFNGISSWIKIPNSEELNSDSSITVAFWMKVTGLYPDREQYPVSHGNWQNRWKVSISNPSNRLRWTVKTGTATRDLDSRTALALNTDYHVVCTYNGSDVELYLNGNLDAFSSLTGRIPHTTYDISLGRSLPGEAAYAFTGILDEVRIYDYALSVAEIEAVYGSVAGVEATGGPSLPAAPRVFQNYPNPFNSQTVIRFSVPASSGRDGLSGGAREKHPSAAGVARLSVYDILGREVAVLVNETRRPGTYQEWFDAAGLSSGVYYYRFSVGTYVESRPMILLR